MLEPVFHDLILADQDCFASEEGWQALLHLIPDKDTVANLKENWEADPDRSSEDKWQDVEQEIAEKRGKGNRSYPVRFALSRSPVCSLICDAS